MDKNKRYSRSTPAYSTYTLLDKGKTEPVTNIANPPVDSIELAKEEVDANEK